jgi:toxin FitB
VIILDTNVVSELTRKRPDKNVLIWLESQNVADLYLSVLTVMEIKFGLLMRSPTLDQKDMSKTIETFQKRFFKNRILPFTFEAAECCAELMSDKRAFTPLGKIADFQIAATAISLGYSVATRDVADFKHKGLNVINPWAD